MKSLRGLGLLVALSVAGWAGEIWVAPDGLDTNPGTRERPVAQVATALRRAREWRRLRDPAVQDGATIVLRGGTYSLSESIFIRPEDGGTATAPTRIVAAPGETPVLDGGVAIRDWRLLTEPPAALPASARGQVWVAELPNFNGRPLEFRQLWVDSRKATRARLPDEGQLERLTTWDRTQRVGGIPRTVPLPANLAGVEMVLVQAWEIAVLRLREAAKGNDETRLTFQEPESRVQFEHPWPPPPMPGKDGQNAPFFLTNSLEFLDAAGEWFADLRAGKVYYWPRAGEDLTTAKVVAPALERLVRIAGTYDRPVRHVQIEGLTFAHTTWLRPSLAGHVPLQAGFFMIDAYSLKPKGTPDWRSLDNQAWLGRPPAAVSMFAVRDACVTACRFERVAANALDLHLGVQDLTVAGNVFRDIGINAVVAGTFGEEGIEAHLPYEPTDEREFTARLRIANNVIADCANEDWGGVPVIAGFVRDTAIEFNDISDTSYSGISVGWGWTRTANVMRNNRVHANRIQRSSTRVADSGGIYTLSNQPGLVVSENAIFEIKISPWVHDPQHWFYLYTDEGSSFVTVRDNWCHEAKFLENAIGIGNQWSNNGPQVDAKIKDAAGLQPEFRTKLAAELAR